MPQQRRRGSTLYQNQLVLVTGGSSGIGYQLAHDFLRLGAQVVIVADRAERLEQARESLSAVSSDIHAVQCDVGSWVSVESMAQQVLERFGTPDILVNNAGFGTYRTFEATSIDEVERLVSVNLVGGLRCAKAFLPAMIARRHGSIVNITSIAGCIPITPHGTYSAAKFGTNVWASTLRNEVKRFGIRVHVVCPGRVDTPFFEHETFKSRKRQGFESRINITTEDVSRATLRALERGSFMTYVPAYLGPLQWLIKSFPVVFNVPIGWLTRRRIETLYHHSRTGVTEVRAR